MLDRAARPASGRHRAPAAVALAVFAAALAATPLHAQEPARAEPLGQVTLLTGTPRMPGQAVRRAMPVISGQPIQTGPQDAVGVLLRDLVVHVGVDADVRFETDADATHIIVDSGFVAFYHDEGFDRRVLVDTPFGRLEPGVTAGFEAVSGAYTVRHDPGQPNVQPAASTFSVIEGNARAEGLAPKAGPHRLVAGQMWVIRAGSVPGDPVAGDESSAAEELGALLHREAIDALRRDVTILTPERELDLGAPVIFEITTPPGQGIIEIDDVARVIQAPPPVPPVLGEFQLRIVAPQPIPAGDALAATADFVSYDGIVRDLDWNESLAAVNGEPAFRPQYIRTLPNAGLSYVQFAGPDVEIQNSLAGEPFMTGPRNGNTGWAFFAPTGGVGDGGFNNANPSVSVFDTAMQRIANALHLDSGGTIGPATGNNASGFAILDNAADPNVQLNPDLPTGFPLLQRATDTTGLEVGGDVVADQLAALGAGRDPLNLGQPAPQLNFISNANVDANGDGFDFDGNPIVPTDFALPGDQTVRTDAVAGVPTLAVPLAANSQNTVGLQIAPRGDVVAIIHHDGTRPGPQGTFEISTHFELVRGPRATVVRWRGDARPAGPGGDPLEFEQLNEQPAVRDELFGVIADEVNTVVPDGRQTIFGPAIADPAATAATRINRGRQQIVRQLSGSIVRSPIETTGIAVDKEQIRSSRSQRLGTGLLREGNSGVDRRYLGYNRAR
jgi:hypothetical protein